MDNNTTETEDIIIIEEITIITKNLETITIKIKKTIKNSNLKNMFLIIFLINNNRTHNNKINNKMKNKNKNDSFFLPSFKLLYNILIYWPLPFILFY